MLIEQTTLLLLFLADHRHAYIVCNDTIFDDLKSLKTLSLIAK